MVSIAGPVVKMFSVGHGFYNSAPPLEELADLDMKREPGRQNIRKKTLTGRLVKFFHVIADGTEIRSLPSLRTQL